METEKWGHVEAASAQADRGLEMIERTLVIFGEAVDISRGAVTWDLLPYFWVSLHSPSRPLFVTALGRQFY